MGNFQSFSLRWRFLQVADSKPFGEWVTGERVVSRFISAFFGSRRFCGGWSPDRGRQSRSAFTRLPHSIAMVFVMVR
jgi:hypothetical protein